LECGFTRNSKFTIDLPYIPGRFTIDFKSRKNQQILSEVYGDIDQRKTRNGKSGIVELEWG